MEQQGAPPSSAYRQGVAEWSGPPTGFDEAGSCPACGIHGGACEGACGGEDDCGRLYHCLEHDGQLWFRGDFLLWWTKSANLVPLVTTSDEVDFGILGYDTTKVLFGGDGVGPGARAGGRFTLGYSLSQCQDSSIEATYLFLGNRAATFSQTSAAGDPLLARPYYDLNNDVPDQTALLIAYPDVAINSKITAALSNELQSFEILSRQAIFRECGHRLDFLFGYRYGRFSERLAIDTLFTAGDSSYLYPAGNKVQMSDVFSADNEFHGVDLGIAAKTDYDRWSLECLAKLALGATRSRVSIYGLTNLKDPDTGEETTTPGGLLAQTTNIGRYTRNEFSAIPELGLNVGYNVTPRLKATCGYSVIYLSQVARPGDQIDANKDTTSTNVKVNVNSSQSGGGDLTGVPSPGYRFVTTDFWAQGLTFGLDYRF